MKKQIKLGGKMVVEDVEDVGVVEPHTLTVADLPTQMHPFKLSGEKSSSRDVALSSERLTKYDGVDTGRK